MFLFCYPKCSCFNYIFHKRQAKNFFRLSFFNFSLLGSFKRSEINKYFFFSSNNGLLSRFFPPATRTTCFFSSFSNNGAAALLRAFSHFLCVLSFTDRQKMACYHGRLAKCFTCLPSLNCYPMTWELALSLISRLQIAAWICVRAFKRFTKLWSHI